MCCARACVRACAGRAAAFLCSSLKRARRRGRDWAKAGCPYSTPPFTEDTVWATLFGLGEGVCPYSVVRGRGPPSDLSGWVYPYSAAPRCGFSGNPYSPHPAYAGRMGLSGVPCGTSAKEKTLWISTLNLFERGWGKRRTGGSDVLLRTCSCERLRCGRHAQQEASSVAVIHASMHACMHPCARASMHPCIHTSIIHAHMHT